MMSNDLDWTSDLGEAVVEDQGAVLEASRCSAARPRGPATSRATTSRRSWSRRKSSRSSPPIRRWSTCRSTNRALCRFGRISLSYGYYPAPYPSYYYRTHPVPRSPRGVIWGAAIGAAWTGGHYVSHYGGGGNNNINIDNSKNINTGGRGGSASQRPAGSGSGSSQWKSNKQPGQVSGSVGKTSSSARAGDARGGGAAGHVLRPSQAGGGAFGGSNASGRQTQMDSSRGASSRGSASGAGAGAGSRPSPSMSGGGGGGGARASGGGGGGWRTRWRRWRPRRPVAAVVARRWP